MLAVQSWLSTCVERVFQDALARNALPALLRFPSDSRRELVEAWQDIVSSRQHVEISRPWGLTRMLADPLEVRNAVSSLFFFVDGNGRFKKNNGCS